jgi:hypothetical protein
METVKTGESFGVSVTKGNMVTGTITEFESGRVYGRTKLYINGKLVHNETKPVDVDGFNPNAIIGGDIDGITGLKAYFAECMTSNVNRALVTADLNATRVQISPAGSNTGASSGKHGIIVANGPDDGAGPVYTIGTIVQSPSNTYGRKWRGTITAPTPVQFSYAAIGHGIKAESESVVTDNFLTTYATQTFPTQVLATDDQLTIDWEIFIA